MVHWSRFDPAAFDLEFNEEKLAAHGIEAFEVVEVLWNGFQPVRDKGHESRYEVRIRPVVHWSRFDPAAFDLEFNEEKLAAHGIEAFEVVEVLWNGFQPVRDKGHESRYRLLGRTDSGRALEVVVVVVDKRTLRFITGWPL